MNKIKVAVRLCEKENDLTFKEKFEIARQLEKLCVDSIEFPELSGGKEDTLLVRTCASFVKNATLSVAVSDTAGIAVAADALLGAKKAALRVELSLSPVGMEYTHHKKAPKMLEYITAIVSAAKQAVKSVEFCALDATRAEKDFLLQALAAAEAAGATSVRISDDAGEMLPDEFALFAEECAKCVTVPLGVACSNKSGFALSSAVLSAVKGAKGVCAVIAGDGVDLEALSECVKNSGNRNGIATAITYTELHRTVKQIKRIITATADSPIAAAPSLEQTKISLDDKDDMAAVIDATKKIGYDLSDEDKVKVYEEFLRVAAKKRVGAKELDAIVASVALQVPATYKLVSYVVNNGNVIRASAQITLTKNGETLTGIMMGDGPIDAAFLCLEQIIGTHYELDDFEIQSVTEGKEAMGSALVKLRKDGKLFSGKGISTDIIGASIRAYLSAVNKIAYEEE